MENKKIQDFKDLKAWQEGHRLAILVYEITENFPHKEMYSLVDQMRRAVVSVTSNIAEGFGRHSYKEKANFYKIAQGSLAELENQTLLAKDIGYIDTILFNNFEVQLKTTQKLLGGLISKTKSFFSPSFHSNLKSPVSNLSSKPSSNSNLRSLISVLFLVSSLCSLFSPHPADAFTLSKSSNNLLGLIGWWSFDGKDMPSGKATDLSGNGNSGSPVNISTSTFYTLGKIGQGLRFNGANYVSAGDIDAIDNATSLTAAFWVYFTRFDTIDDLVTKYDSVGTEGPRIWVSTSQTCSVSETNTFVVQAFEGLGGTDNNCLISDTDTAKLNQWTHVVVTIVPGNSTGLRMFINGVQDVNSPRSLSTVSNIDSTTANFMMAGTNPSTAGCKCILDDVRIYNRALSASEILQLYNMGAGTKVNVTPKEPLKSGLVGHWTFDGKDISNGRVNDVSGNGNYGNFMSSFSTTTGYVMGKIGQAVNFKGLVTNNGITIAGAGVNVGTSYTFATWVNWRDCSVGGYCVLMESKTGSDPGWYIRKNVGGVQSFYTGAGGDHNSATVVPPNSWHHVAVVNNAGTVNFYMDGVQDANSYTAQPAGVFGCIGSNTHSSCYGVSDYADASYDDFRAYNRALSASEIKQLYSMGTGTKVNVTPKDPLTSGLVGHWTFDGKDMPSGKATDRSGNGNSGSPVNISTSTFYTLGKIGQALNFDGVDDYVRLPASSTLVPNVNTWTISFWFKASQIGSASLGNRMIAILNSAANSLILFALGSDNQLKFFYRNATPSGVTNIVTNVSTNTWYHAVATYNGTSYLVYVNGASPTTYTDTIDTASTDLALFASSNPPPGNSFSGKIDDVRIYNRALSASEVLQLYNMGR